MSGKGIPGLSKLRVKPFGEVGQNFEISGVNVFIQIQTVGL